MITWSPAFQPCNYSLCIPVYAVTFTAVKCCYFLLPGPGRDLSLPSTGSSLFCQQKDITMHINNVSVLTEAFSGFGLDACWNQCKGKAAEQESPAPGVSLRGCDAASGRLHETQGSFMAAWPSPEGARLTSAWCRVLSLGKGSSRHSGEAREALPQQPHHSLSAGRCRTNPMAELQPAPGERQHIATAMSPGGKSAKSEAPWSPGTALGQAPGATQVWHTRSDPHWPAPLGAGRASSARRCASHPLRSNGENAAKMAVRERNTSLVIISNQKSPPLLQAPSFQPYSNKVTPF